MISVAQKPSLKSKYLTRGNIVLNAYHKIDNIRNRNSLDDNDRGNGSNIKV